MQLLIRAANEPKILGPTAGRAGSAATDVVAIPRLFPRKAASMVEAFSAISAVEQWMTADEDSGEQRSLGG